MDYSQLIASNLNQADNKKIDPSEIWTPDIPKFGETLRKLFKHTPRPTVVQVIPAE